ncbi:MAG: Calx-beta domain-containing protein, partial [Candidatus Promineifilaceae bacterium]
GMLFVTINGETKTHDFALATSVYAADQLYFSVGSQPQDNTLDAAGEAAEVQFHSLTVTHIDPIAAVVTINDATVSEGEDAVLVIGLDNVRDTDTTMQVQTVDGTATGAATDYESVNITATIAAGTFSTTVTIQTIDDADVEGQETLTVALSSLTGTNVTFADDQAQVIITEDDSNETSTTVTIDPAVGTTLTFSNAVGSEATPVTTIQVPAGSVSETMTLMYNAIDEETDDVEFEFAGTRFDMTAYVNGEVYEHYTFAGPVTVTLHYSDTQIASMREDTLRLQFWTGSDWIDAAATCYGDDPTQVPDDAYVRDEGNQTISVEICHLTEFAMFAEPFYRYYLPVWFHND